MNNDFNLEVGKKLYKARKEKGMTRAELGKLVDLHESTIKRYEDGFIKSLSIDRMAIFGNYLGVTPEYLMGWNKREESIAEIVNNMLVKNGFDLNTESGKEEVFKILNMAVEIYKMKKGI
jgi:transcriptional regulator with XRE-family HTH domain